MLKVISFFRAGFAGLSIINADNFSPIYPNFIFKRYTSVYIAKI